MDSYRRCVFVYFFASFLTLLSYRAMPADLLEEAPNVTASAGPILAEDTARLLSLGTFCPSRSHSEHQGCKNRQSFTSRAHHGCHFGLDRTALCKHNANGASYLRIRTTGARTSSTRRSQDRTYRQQQVQAAIRFCQVLFGDDYASLMSRAAENAATGERKSSRAS